MATSKAWNPRYAAFARSRGRTPEEQLDHDHGPEAEFPGATMLCFSQWIDRHLYDWRVSFPPGTRLTEFDPRRLMPATDEEQQAFDEYLNERAAAEAAALEGKREPNT